MPTTAKRYDFILFHLLLFFFISFIIFFSFRSVAATWLGLDDGSFLFQNFQLETGNLLKFWNALLSPPFTRELNEIFHVIKEVMLPVCFTFCFQRLCKLNKHHSCQVEEVGKYFFYTLICVLNCERLKRRYCRSRGKISRNLPVNTHYYIFLHILYIFYYLYIYIIVYIFTYIYFHIWDRYFTDYILYIFYYLYIFYIYIYYLYFHI